MSKVMTHATVTWIKTFLLCRISTYPSSDLILLHIRSFAALSPHLTLGSLITEHFIIFAFVMSVDFAGGVWHFFWFALFFSCLRFLPSKLFFLYRVLGMRSWKTLYDSKWSGFKRHCIMNCPPSDNGEAMHNAVHVHCFVVLALRK